MSSRRVSIKGQGAAIFFGPGAEESRRLLGETPLPPSHSPRNSRTSVRPDVTTSRRQEVKTDGSAAGHPSSLEDVRDEARRFLQSLALPGPLRRKLRGVLRGERRIHTTVRFNAEELAALRDLVYELEAKMGIRVTRNEVMRIALHFFLEDYALRKEKSLLLQVLREEQEEY